MDFPKAGPLHLPPELLGPCEDREERGQPVRRQRLHRRRCGLVFLVIGGPKEWMLPIALAVTVLLSTYGGRIPVMWRQAPIPAAIVIASGVAHQSKLSGIDQGLHKVAEVIFGCGAGIAVSWLMSRVWPVVPANEAATAARPGA